MKFGINDRAAEHIAGYGIEHIFLFLSYLAYISRQKGYSSYKIVIDLFGQKVSVHIIRVKQRKLLEVFHI